MNRLRVGHDTEETIDLSKYHCERCHKLGVCEDGMDAFVACLCQSCEAQANRLLDKVHQIMKEGLHDTLGWKDYPQGWRESDMNPDQVSEFIDTRRDQS